jgi:hypothetical protein
MKNAITFDRSVIAGGGGAWLCRSILFVNGEQRGANTTPLRDADLTTAPAAWRANEAALLMAHAEGNE